MDDGRRRKVVWAARLLMTVLAVGTGWGAVAAAGGTGHAMDVELAGPPAAWVAAAPPALAPGPDGALGTSADAAELARQDRSSSASRSRDRLDPRFAGCGEALVAGFGPYLQGQDVEYAWYPDADGDGVACP